MRLIPLLVVLLTAGCTHARGPAGNTKDAAAPGRLSGTVTSRARIALPPTAVVEITLFDVSRTDVPAVAIATQAIPVEDKTVPIRFELSYDPAKIQPQMAYEVGAKVKEGDKVTWISVGKYPVITRESPTTVEIHLVQVTEP